MLYQLKTEKRYTRKFLLEGHQTIRADRGVLYVLVPTVEALNDRLGMEVDEVQVALQSDSWWRLYLAFLPLAAHGLHRCEHDYRELILPSYHDVTEGAELPDTVRDHLTELR
jgi:hypothetical protein